MAAWELGRVDEGGRRIDKGHKETFVSNGNLRYLSSGDNVAGVSNVNIYQTVFLKYVLIIVC